jgi:Flp pilus assembly protein TadG
MANWTNNRERGAVAIIVAVLLTVMIGFLGLAIDVSYAYLQKTRLQAVADAEALACAVNPSSAPCPVSGGDVYPAVNPSGFTIAISNPGDSSLCPLPATQTDCAKATASSNWNTFFITLFGVKKINLSASATAGTINQNPCMLSLASPGAGITMTGSGAITTINCGIGVNQTGTSISMTGSGSITASPINVMGSVSKTGSGSISPVTKITTPIPDPFASNAAPAFTPPPPSSCTSSSKLTFSGSSSNTVPAGNYCGGVSNTGSGNITFNPGYYAGISNAGSGTVTFNPGNYVIYNTGLNVSGSANVTMGAGNYVVFGGGLSFTGSSSVAGSGITIYNSGNATYPAGSLSITGSGGFNLSAPLSGPQQGMLFFQPASNTNDVTITGSSSSVFNGNLYTPTAALTMTGSGGAALPFGAIIAKNITLTGSGAISVTNAFIPNGGGSTKPVLVN